MNKLKIIIVAIILGFGISLTVVNCNEASWYSITDKGEKFNMIVFGGLGLVAVALLLIYSKKNQ